MNCYSAFDCREANTQYDNEYDNQVSWFSTLSLIVFYSFFGYICKKTIDTYYNIKPICNLIKEYPQYQFKSINPSHDDEYKQTLFNNLLSINSLNRCYILYFIFKRKGDFKTTNYQNKNTTNNTIIEKEYNSYELYNKMIENTNLTKEDFNLDETIEPDICINIGNNKYTITMAQLRFIQWIYTIGLYDYLMNNSNIKYDILNEMNEQNLLSGNLFLLYQLFLCDYEYELNINNKMNKYLIKIEETEETNEINDTDETDETEDTEETNEINDTEETEETQETEDTEETNEINDTEETNEINDNEEIDETEEINDTEEIDETEEINDTKETEDTEETEETDENELLKHIDIEYMNEYIIKSMIKSMVKY